MVSDSGALVELIGGFFAGSFSIALAAFVGMILMLIDDDYLNDFELGDYTTLLDWMLSDVDF